MQFTKKSVLQDKQECRVFANMDSSMCIPLSCHNKSEIKSENKPINDVTSFAFGIFKKTKLNQLFDRTDLNKFTHEFSNQLILFE